MPEPSSTAHWSSSTTILWVCLFISTPPMRPSVKRRRIRVLFRRIWLVFSAAFSDSPPPIPPYRFLLRIAGTRVCFPMLSRERQHSYTIAVAKPQRGTSVKQQQCMLRPLSRCTRSETRPSVQKTSRCVFRSPERNRYTQ